MSRTYKDTPFRVKEERIKSTRSPKTPEDQCKLCSDETVVTRTSRLTGIFFAHELQEQQKFIALAEKLGYTHTSIEAQGYLGRSVNPSYLRARSELLKTMKEERAIYSEPRGAMKNLLYDVNGKFDKDNLPDRGLFSRSLAWEYKNFFQVNEVHVSHKRNVFTVITIEKTRESKVNHFRHHHEDFDDALSLFLYGSCRCSWCEPDEQGAKTGLRTIEAKIRKAFNSGDMDAVDEIANTLVVSGHSARRTNYC